MPIAGPQGFERTVTFRNEDLFEAGIREASVVTLYLSTSLSLNLRPKLWHDLKPGTRVVSQTSDMGGLEAGERRRG